jgi:hypothetical protein
MNFSRLSRPTPEEVHASVMTLALASVRHLLHQPAAQSLLDEAGEALRSTVAGLFKDMEAQVPALKGLEDASDLVVKRVEATSTELRSAALTSSVLRAMHVALGQLGSIPIAEGLSAPFQKRVSERVAALELGKIEMYRRFPSSREGTFRLLSHVRKAPESRLAPAAFEWTVRAGLPGRSLLAAAHAIDMGSDVFDSMFCSPAPRSAGNICASFLRTRVQKNPSKPGRERGARFIVRSVEDESGSGVVLLRGPDRRDVPLCFGTGKLAWLREGRSVVVATDLPNRQTLLRFVEHLPGSAAHALQGFESGQIWVETPEAGIQYLDTRWLDSRRVLVLYGSRSSYTGESTDTQYVVYDTATKSPDVEFVLTDEQLLRTIEAMWPSRVASVTTFRERVTRVSEAVPERREFVPGSHVVRGDGECVFHLPGYLVTAISGESGRFYAWTPGGVMWDVRFDGKEWQRRVKMPASYEHLVTDAIVSF